MSISPEELKKIAQLACLDIEDSEASLPAEINAIMDFVEQLSSVDTSNVIPMAHPFALHQRLRADVLTESDCLAELEALAPLFEDNLYLVPKVLESDK